MNARPIPELTATDILRFWALIEKTDGCWIWKGVTAWTARTKFKQHDYGVFPIHRNGIHENYKAHRITKALATEDHPELDIDHLCENRLCVNPAHLEWVTQSENSKRTARRRTQCRRGHDLTLPNARMKRGNSAQGCRACSIEWRQRKRARQREVA